MLSLQSCQPLPLQDLKVNNMQDKSLHHVTTCQMLSVTGRHVLIHFLSQELPPYVIPYGQTVKLKAADT